MVSLKRESGKTNHKSFITEKTWLPCQYTAVHEIGNYNKENVQAGSLKAKQHTVMRPKPVGFHNVVKTTQRWA